MKKIINYLYIMPIVFSIFSFQAFAETKTIHVLVALCDNKYQKIVPVPQAIGNGQDPKNNLYWGLLMVLKPISLNKKSGK